MATVIYCRFFFNVTGSCLYLKWSQVTTIIIKSVDHNCTAEVWIIMRNCIFHFKLKLKALVQLENQDLFFFTNIHNFALNKIH